jgi:hypothetical protein
VAALIAEATGIQPDVVEGARGEFSIRVNDDVVARKDANGFPRDEDAVARVKARLAR